ncbi:MAG: hypothetical protein J7K84_07555 [Deltaproteobacteria bacterium]|nr:hypothetical protein [Deltaproteobacteria bacterium]
MGYDSFENPAPMCEEIAQILTDMDLLQRERKVYRLIAESSILSKSIPGFCQIIVNGLVKILEFDLGIIRLKSDNNNLFRVIASAGIPERLKKKLKPSFPGDSESIAMLAVTTGKPIFAPDITTHKIRQPYDNRIDTF